MKHSWENSNENIIGYRVLERVPKGPDRTKGMTKITGINQLRPHELKFQVS